MAAISITPTALGLVRALLHELEQLEKAATGFLIVSWFPGASDNFRDQKGGAVWEQMELSEWRASVGGWKEPQATTVRQDALSIEEVLVLLDARAEQARGTLTTDAPSGYLNVIHTP